MTLGQFSPSVHPEFSQRIPAFAGKNIFLIQAFVIDKLGFMVILSQKFLVMRVL